MLYECLKVISTCHTNGMTHGDVKPAVRWPLHMNPEHDLRGTCNLGTMSKCFALVLVSIQCSRTAFLLGVMLLLS